MKIYKFEFDLYKNEVTMYEAEVKENPRTYAVIGDPVGIYERLIFKDTIGVLDRSFDRKMFLLEPDRRRFINALLIDQDREIDEFKSKLDEFYKRRDIYLDMIEKEKCKL